MNKTLLFPSESKQVHIALIWLVLVVVSLFSRSYLPIDETRYVTVAWNMYLNHDYWVPYLNGDTYSHKPPLLFWLMNIGWQIFAMAGCVAVVIALLTVSYQAIRAALMNPVKSLRAE